MICWVSANRRGGLFDGGGFVLAHDVSFVNGYGNEAAAVAAKRFSDGLSLFVTYYNNIQLYCNGVFGRIFAGCGRKGGWRQVLEICVKAV